MRLISFLLIYVFLLLLANAAFAAPQVEKMFMSVGKKRSLSEKNYIFFKVANPNIVSVSRDAFTRAIKIEAIKPGQTFFIFQEVGSENARRVAVQVANKPMKVRKAASSKPRVGSCKRRTNLRFGDDCHFFLPGWNR